MAPRARGRGRSSKKNTRMTAAIEHMVPMGFDESLIRSTLEELLKIYTEEYWFFIEENSYKVLLEALLEKTSQTQLEQGEGRALLEHDKTGEETGLTTLSAGSSTAPPLPPCGTETPETVQLIEPPELPRRRQPYYGWISSTELGAVIKELPPMPLDVFQEKLRWLPLGSEMDRQ